MNNPNKNTLTYKKVGDYDIPGLILDDRLDKETGIYGRMRQRYLEDHHPGRYSYMLLSGKLYSHLLAVDEVAQGYLDTVLPRIAAAAAVTEELKTSE